VQLLLALYQTQIKGPGHCLPNCFTLLLLQYSIKCIRLIDNVYELSNPKPRRRFRKPISVPCISPMQNLRQILGFAICWTSRVRSPAWWRKIPKGSGSFSWFLWRSFNHPLWFAPNCNPSTTIRFSKCIDFKSNASEYP